MKTMFAFMTMLLIALSGKCDTLWWLVNESATVDGESLQSFIQPYAWAEDGYSGYDVGARIKAIYKDGSSELLPILQSWDGGSWSEFPYAVVDDAGDGNGIGTGNWATQTPLNGIDSELLVDALFQIELGSLSYSEALDIFAWDTTIAASDKIAREYLSRNIWPGGVAVPADGQWTPIVFYSTPVPEPNSLLMCIFGLSLLLVKRRL